MTVALSGDTASYTDPNRGSRTADLVITADKPYPAGATPLVAGSGNVANASGVATLTPGSGKTMYLTGFEITGAGATGAAAVTVTVAGLLGGTRSYTYGFVAGAGAMNQPLIPQFFPGLPASAVDTAIVVTCPAGGAGALLNTVVAHGYYL